MSETDIAQFHKTGPSMWIVWGLWASCVTVPALVTFWGFLFRSRTCCVLGVCWLCFNVWMLENR